MKNSAVLGSGVAALFAGVTSAQSYDAENICGEDKYGEYSDDLVYLPNAWNDKSPDDGFACMSVEDSVPAFDATWNWQKDISDVHNYAYVRMNHDDLPAKLSAIKEMTLATDWMMTDGSPSSPPRSFSKDDWSDKKKELEDDGVMANAAWDFFLDEEFDNVHDPTNSKIEIMVWLGSVGSPQWLGHPKSDKDGFLKNITMGDVEFSVYHAKNFRKRDVFTCVSTEDVNSFEADFTPLFEYILENPTDDDDFPEDPYMGIVEFGSETWLSAGNVTFTAANYKMELDADKSDSDSGGNGGNGGSGGTSDDDDDSASSSLGMSVLAALVPVAVMASLF